MISRRLGLTLLLLLPAACASQGPQSQLGSQERALQEQRLELTRTSDCAFQSSINGFDTLDARHVVLFSGGRRRLTSRRSPAPASTSTARYRSWPWTATATARSAVTAATRSRSIAWEGRELPHPGARAAVRRPSACSRARQSLRGQRRATKRTAIPAEPAQRRNPAEAGLEYAGAAEHMKRHRDPHEGAPTMRVLLFVLTNFAILLVASVTLRLLGVEPWLNANGINFNSLLIFGALLGFGGAFLSLAMSKWTAKRAMGVQVIAEPRNEQEAWLVETVRRQARPGGHQHAGSGLLRLPGAQRVCDRRAAQQRAGRRQHRPHAAHEPQGSRGRPGPRGEPRRQRRHGHAHADPGRREHFRVRRFAASSARSSTRSYSATSAARARLSGSRPWSHSSCCPSSRR